MKRKRDANGRFCKGVSGNPGGQPKKHVHLTALLRDAAADKHGEWLANVIWELVTQGKTTLGTGKVIDITTARDWLNLVSWLVERLDGKALQPIKVEEAPEIIVSVEDFKAAKEQLKKWRDNGQ